MVVDIRVFRSSCVTQIMRIQRAGPVIFAAILSGCGSVNGEYGYLSSYGQPPRPDVSESYQTFQRLAESYLESELQSRCRTTPQKFTIEKLGHSEVFAEFNVRGLKNCVTDVDQWEKLQVSFTQTKGNSNEIIISMEGLIAPGYYCPKDSQFTTKIESKHLKELVDFHDKLTSDLRDYGNKGQ